MHMVTVAQSAADWRNMHTGSRGSHAFTHSLTSTHLHQHTITTLCEAQAQLFHNLESIFYFERVPEEGGANRSTRRKTPTVCLLIGYIDISIGLSRIYATHLK